MKTLNLKVTQLNGKNGPVKNQITIQTNDGIYFQSYKSIVAAKLNNGTVLLDKTYWDYSQTTGKYRNQFLGESKKETERKIKEGFYILCNLNA